MDKQQSNANAADDVVWVESDSPPTHHSLQAAAAAEQTQFTIGELAREFDVTLRALRFYENKGLITPHRDKNMRLYSQHDRSRLAAILTGKKLGFTLAEIRTMIAAQDGARSPESLKVTKEKCLEQILMLEKQQRSIKEALTELWRIHAGLSAEIVRIDWKEPASGASVPCRAGV